MSVKSISSIEDDAVVIDCDDISNYNPEYILPESQEEIDKIRGWLQATNYAQDGGEYRKHFQAHIPGTGDWLISSESFKTWLGSDNDGLLWVKGIPGSGKSVFAAHIVNFLALENPGSPVLYFFFRQIIDANHEPSALLRDWLDQILEYSPPLQKELKEVVESNLSIKSFSMGDLWKLLRLAIESLPGKVFCVADALDEMDTGNGEFLQSLAAIGQWKPNKVKVMLTSRPIAVIENSLRRINMLRLRLEEKMVDTDISTFVERGLRNSPGITEKERMQIREAVPGRANGIFLYAKLAMDALLEPGAQVAHVLRSLPADLHELYTRLLREHSLKSAVPRDIQLLILQWVTHANRSLRLLELAEMISITHKSADSPGMRRDIASTKNLVRATAGPLLEILPNETVCVIHHSFTEYLKCINRPETDDGYPILRLGATHRTLALACIAYLQAGCLDAVEVPKQDKHNDCVEEDDWLYHDINQFRELRDSRKHEEQRIRLQYPFFNYAVSNWQVHVARSSAAGFPQDDINSALRHIWGTDRHLRAWVKHKWSHRREGSTGVTSLHVAARYGLLHFVSNLLSNGADVNAKDCCGKTALWWAANSGHADIIRLLEKAGADPDADDRLLGLKPLHKAASKNHAEAVKVLLELGVDPLTPKTRENPRKFPGMPLTLGDPPLMYACHSGHFEALEAFLPFLADITTVHWALIWSVEKGQSKLVRRILQHPGVEVNCKVRGETPLYVACQRRDRDIINILLDARADPNVICSDAEDESVEIESMHGFSIGLETDEPRGHTAIFALCKEQPRHRFSRFDDLETLYELVSLLLARGANVNQKQDCGETPLHAAVNKPMVVRLLLSAGADANIADDYGSVPLHSAQCEESVALLIEEGKADINTIDPADGRCPLLRALGSSHTAFVRKILDYNPNMTIRDKSGSGPLHIALANWNIDPDIIKRLLSAGADPNERNQAGETPIMGLQIVNKNFYTILDTLLESGADINAKDMSGMTILSRLICNYSACYKTAIQGLLERGSDPFVRDHKGKSLLHYAISSYNGDTMTALTAQSEETILGFLVGLGLDSNVVDYQGNTWLHQLALRSRSQKPFYLSRYSPLLEQLWTLGFDPNVRNHLGRTVLHILAATRPRWRYDGFECEIIRPLDLLLSKLKDLDQRDYRGLTALHLASTVSQFMTKRLLELGANPTLTTNEGLSPLHLAARARQSNIVGLLIASGKQFGASFVDLEDKKGRTALFYACQAGIPETVNLLVSAGADASKKVLLDACAGFETEQRLWGTDCHSVGTERNQDACGLYIDDKSRPVWTCHKQPSQSKIDIDLGNDVPRLEEILELLVTKGCDISYVSALLEKDMPTYTYGCLLRVQEAYQSTSNPKRASTRGNQFKERLCKSLQDAYTDAAVHAAHSSEVIANHLMITKLLQKRQYHVMEALFDKGIDFMHGPDSSHCGSILGTFIDHGYVSLLTVIGNLEAERQLRSGEFHAFNEPSQSGLYKKNNLEDANKSGYKQCILLLDALTRETPNMEVVRLLVEKFRVDVNQCYHNTGTDKDWNQDLVPYESALHYVANGFHWWHVALAMPYLISKGANLHARDENGSTPLHIAIGGFRQCTGLFNEDAVRTLLAAGADFNALDRNRSCLSLSIYNMSILRLLIESGASIKADAVIEAITWKQVDALEALLQAGADPNLRNKLSSASDRSRSKSPYLLYEIPDYEIYPLYAAATRCRRNESSEAIQMMNALLSHGADPFATFKRRDLSYSAPKDENEMINEELLSLCKTIEGFEEVTILHELLEVDDLVHPILSASTLDASRRDAKGRTIAHMVCHNHSLFAPIDSVFAAYERDFMSSMPSFLDCLLQQGADMLATDRDGRNILHHLFGNRSGHHHPGNKLSDLSKLIRQYPSLLNAPDIEGKTPLHMALKNSVQRHSFAAADIILEEGADAFAIDVFGNSCLHIVASCIHQSESARVIFKRLIDCGLDINTRNHRGETPIFLLYRNFALIRFPPNEESISAAEAVSVFENAGADLFVKNNSGESLLHIAAQETQESVTTQRKVFCPESEIRKPEPSTAQFETLLRKGLDPMIEDNQKRTALDIAAACGNATILKLFEEGEGARTKPTVP